MATYDSLVTAIKAYTENDDSEFAAMIPTFIENTELNIYRTLDLNKFRKYATANIDQGVKIFKKPDDFVIDRYMVVKDRSTGNTSSFPDHYLEAKDVSLIRTYWPTSSAEGFPPKYYAEWDENNLIIAPTPDRDIKLVLAYTYRPEGLSSSNQTTWLGTNASDLLLYGSLAEAYRFMKNRDGDVVVWATEFDKAMTTLKNEEENRQRYEDQRYGEPRGQAG